MGTSYNPPIVTDGLVCCLDAANVRSYPKSGTTWSDLIGSNDGIMNNMDASNFSSENSGSLSFDGSNEYITIPDLGLNTSAFSCCAIFKFNNSTVGNNTIFNLNYYYPNSGYLIRKHNSSNKIVVYSDDGSERNVVSSFDLITNKIYNIVVVQNNDNVKIYFDGVLDTNTTLLDPVLNSSYDSYIGRRGAPAIGAYLNANVYSASVYSKVLTGDEVRQNYEATVGRFT